MSKRAFIIHCWGGSPDEGWYSWVKLQLEQKGFFVAVPEMPDTENPKIEAWVNHVKEVVGEVDEQTFFIGHSIGCQTIMRFLETLPEGKKIGGAVFVAGWFHLVGLGDEEFRIVEPWVSTPIDYKKAVSHINQSTAIFSDNDPFVSLAEKQIFEEQLHAKIIILHAKGHLGGDSDVLELPEVLEAILC